MAEKSNEQSPLSSDQYRLATGTTGVKHPAYQFDYWMLRVIDDGLTLLVKDEMRKSGIGKLITGGKGERRELTDEMRHNRENPIGQVCLTQWRVHEIRQQYNNEIQASLQKGLGKKTEVE